MDTEKLIDLFLKYNKLYEKYENLEDSISNKLNNIRYITNKNKILGFFEGHIIMLSREENSLSFYKWYCIKSVLPNEVSANVKSNIELICDELDKWIFPENVIINFEEQEILNPKITTSYNKVKLINVKIKSLNIFLLYHFSKYSDYICYNIDDTKFVISQLNENNKILCKNILEKKIEELQNIIEYNSEIANNITGYYNIIKYIKS